MFDPEFVSSVGALGPLGFLVIGIGAFAFGWVYSRGAYNEMRADRDAWRELAESSQRDTDKLSNHAEALQSDLADVKRDVASLMALVGQLIRRRS